MITLKSSFKLRKIFATILLCSMLGYISLSLSWMKVSDTETNIGKYLGNISISDRQIAVTLKIYHTYHKRKGSRVSRLVQKSFSQIYKRCGQIFRFFIGGKTKTERFLISVGRFPTFLIFTTATNTGKRKGQKKEYSTCTPPTMMLGRFRGFNKRF